MLIIKKLLIPILLFLTFSTVATPNVVIFIADDVSWDDIGAYGNQDVQTPNIDQLAQNGMVFNNAYLTASSCSPSRNSIMTGRYPHNTGAAELHTEPPIDMLSFPELLQKANYHTVHSGKFHEGEYLKRAFDVIDSAHMNKKVIGDGGEAKWLSNIQNRPRNKPFFMWFAAMDAHRNWGTNQFSGTHNPEKITPPAYLADGKLTRLDLAAYYDEIFRFDHYVGQVVEELKKQNVLENTIIIVMADNGRAFPHSKTRVNDRGMKTPFIVHWPKGIQATSETNELVSVIDIAPTLLNLANINIPEQFQGVDFSSLFAQPNTAVRNYVFAEHNFHDYEAHQRMVRDKNYMYIVNNRPNSPQMGPADAVGSPSFRELTMLKAQGKLSAIQADIFVSPRPYEELYQLADDPEQYLNLISIPKHQSASNQLRDILKQWIIETGDSIPAYLTKDWFLRHPAKYIPTAAKGQRGEMPGSINAATTINNKGPH